MARHIHRLSDVKIRTLRKKGLHADGLGLYLKVTESGSKSWIFRFARAGKRRDMGLGVYPGISLAGARELAKEAQFAIQRGIDPVEAAETASPELARRRKSPHSGKLADATSMHMRRAGKMRSIDGNGSKRSRTLPDQFSVK